MGVTSMMVRMTPITTTRTLTTGDLDGGWQIVAEGERSIWQWTPPWDRNLHMAQRAPWWVKPAAYGAVAFVLALLAMGLS